MPLFSLANIKIYLESHYEHSRSKSNNDWKCKKYRDQKDMIAFGIGNITKTDITEEEFKALLIECQEKRDSVIE